MNFDLTLPVLAASALSAGIVALYLLRSGRPGLRRPLPHEPASLQVSTATGQVGLRRASTSELADLSALAFRSKGRWPYSVEQMEAWRGALRVSRADVEAGRVYVAEVGASPVGFFALRSSGAAWVLDHLWVAPESTGRGVGRVLLQHAARTAGRLGAAELLVHSEPYAEGFYRALGAERLGFVSAPISGQPQRALPVLAVPVPQVPAAAGPRGAGPGLPWHRRFAVPGIDPHRRLKERALWWTALGLLAVAAATDTSAGATSLSDGFSMAFDSFPDP